MLLLRFSGSFLLRFETRAFPGLSFQEAPRSFSALFPLAHSLNFSPGGFAAQKKKGERKKFRGN